MNWERAADRALIIPRGPDGAWDSGMNYSSNRPVIVGDEGAVTLVAVGAFVKEDFQLESRQVMAELVEIGETPQQGYAWLMLVATIAGAAVLFPFIAGVLRDLRKTMQERMKELRQVKDELAQREKQVADLQGRLETYEGKGDNTG